MQIHISDLLFLGVEGTASFLLPSGDFLILITNGVFSLDLYDQREHSGSLASILSVDTGKSRCHFLR